MCIFTKGETVLRLSKIDKEILHIFPQFKNYKIP